MLSRVLVEDSRARNSANHECGGVLCFVSEQQFCVDVLATLFVALINIIAAIQLFTARFDVQSR